MDAIAIVLEQRDGGQSWCISTANLQLASLELCTVCRDVAMLHLRVEKRTPRRLWARGDDQHKSGDGAVPADQLADV